MKLPFIQLAVIHVHWPDMMLLQLKTTFTSVLLYEAIVRPIYVLLWIKGRAFQLS